MKKIITSLAALLILFITEDFGKANVDLPIGSPKFLTLPFKEPDIRITQGWYYDSFPMSRSCEHPNDIPGGMRHCGIDYIKSSPGQTFEVVAAASGRARRFDSPTAGTFVIIEHDQEDPQGRNFFTSSPYAAGAKKV